MHTHMSAFRFIATLSKSESLCVSYDLDDKKWLKSRVEASNSVDVTAPFQAWATITSSDDVKNLTQSKQLVFSGYLPLLASHDRLLVAKIIEAAEAFRR